jgi:3-hydroxy-9,10-secoandrosta-1,3,5(10)-triene-9,17-dione monooxygenase reductase component
VTTATSFRAVMRTLPSGVCVITALGPDGPSGMTASSVSSLSLEPLLIVVGLASSSQTLAALRAVGRFGVNVLGADQAALALRFAARRAGEEKYAGVPHRLEAGTPVIDGAPAWLVCDLRAAHPEGDHALVVGHVRAMAADEQPRAPLVAHAGGLATVAQLATAP